MFYYTYVPALICTPAIRRRWINVYDTGAHPTLRPSFCSVFSWTVLFIISKPLASWHSGTYSARALVKKTQEPGIKLQKADFFRNDTWTSPQTYSEDAPKIPLVHFFLIQDDRHHVTPFSKNRGIP